ETRRGTLRRALSIRLSPVWFVRRRRRPDAGSVLQGPTQPRPAARAVARQVVVVQHFAQRLPAPRPRRAAAALRPPGRRRRPSRAIARTAAGHRPGTFTKGPRRFA